MSSATRWAPKPGWLSPCSCTTACRREDAVRLGPQHIKGGRIRYRQAKNENRNPIDVDIPVHPDLATVLNDTPSGHLTFLVTEYGKPHTANGFGNAFKDWCRSADLPHCSAHGLRKATAARLAERGRRRTRSWPSLATVRLRRSSGTRGRHTLCRWPPLQWPSSSRQTANKHCPTRLARGTNQRKNLCISMARARAGVPTGIRTPVFTVKG